MLWGSPSYMQRPHVGTQASSPCLSVVLAQAPQIQVKWRSLWMMPIPNWGPRHCGAEASHLALPCLNSMSIIKPARFRGNLLWSWNRWKSGEWENRYESRAQLAGGRSESQIYQYILKKEEILYYIYINIYVYLHLYIHTHINTYTHIHAYILVYMCVAFGNHWISASECLRLNSEIISMWMASKVISYLVI